MKKHEVRRLEGLLESICHHLRDQPYALHNLETLLLGCIDLARDGNAWKATAIALEASSFLTDELVRTKQSRPSFQTGVSAYTQVKCEPPRPVATVEQMQAAADAAMNDHIGWFVCTGCGKKTATADGKGPLGWSFNVEVDGEVYKALCAPCFGTGILKQYNCRDCDSTTESRVHPAPGWTDVGDGEFICFACAEEEAEP